MIQEFDVKVVGGAIEDDEKQAYVNRAIDKFGAMVIGMTVMIDHEHVILSYQIRNRPFERIERIR